MTTQLFRRPYPVLVMLFVAVFLSEPGHAEVLATVTMLREGGCGGLLPAARPLRHETGLDRVAQRWAEGGSFAAAAGQTFGESTEGLHVSGSRTALIAALRASHCRLVMDRDASAVGAYERGSETWLVVSSAAGKSTRSAAIPRAAAAAPSPQALAGRALELVNAARAQGARCGTRVFAPAPPLTLSDVLASVARGHADDMASHHYFEHQDLEGRSPADRVRAVGYREKLVGENIAYGPQTVEEAVKGWLASPGHCENLMDPRFVQMGIAVAVPRSSARGGYWVQVLADPRA